MPRKSAKAPKAIEPGKRNKGGRPSKFTQETADAICLALMEGNSLRSICARDGMPDLKTVLNWLHANRGEFFQQYARARGIQAEVLVDQITEIIDRNSDDSGAVSRDKLKADGRFRLAGQLAPKRYGDRIAHTGSDNGPISLVLSDRDSKL